VEKSLAIYWLGGARELDDAMAATVQ
jgi:hypothetical protein